MPLLLSREDLRPLLTDPELIAESLQVIANSLIAVEPFGSPRRPPGRFGESSWWAFPLATGPSNLNIHALTTPAQDTVLRCWPTDRAGSLRHGLTMIFDRADGRLLALLGSGEYLMWRTAGPVVLACHHLAPYGTRTLAMLGTGIQARQHLLGLRRALPDLETIRVHSRDPEHRRAFADHARSTTGLVVRACDHPREAVESAEVVISTAGSVEPVLDPTWVQPGALVTDIFIGVPRSTGTLITPTRALPHEPPSGREPHPEAAAHARPDPARTLGEILVGAHEPRTRPDETLLFTELSIFPWDTALATWAMDWATRHNIGTNIAT